MKALYIFFALALIPILFSCEAASDTMDLSGEWEFSMDRDDLGVRESWHSRSFSETVLLPGSMTTNGKGDPIGLEIMWTGGIMDSSFFTDPGYARFRLEDNYKIPFWLQPDLHYVGAAWYGRSITIPPSWKDKTLELVLERPHWETEVWVNDQRIGSNDRLATVHRYMISGLEPGKHRLTIKVDNRIKEIHPGVNSHSISDHTQSNWNGIVGAITLEARNNVSINEVQVYPDLKDNQIQVEVKLAENRGTEQVASLSLTVSPEGTTDITSSYQGEVQVEGNGSYSFTLDMGENPLVWDEFEPNLYRLEIEVNTGSGAEKEEIYFGMRELSVAGRRFTLNGRPIFLRGALDCAAFPLTGYPPTDTASWNRIYQAMKAHGLNHLRFHSWCPPRAAFEAADRMGIYLQVEASSWANQGVTIGDGAPLDQWLYEEGEAMIRE
jgi:beta-galactosidase/beta-glucuronidase